MTRLIALFAALLHSALLFGQRETYDLVSFVPPAGWERAQQTSVLSFTQNTASKTGFCVMAIYASRPGTTDLVREFQNEWNDLIKKTKQLEVPQNPQITKSDTWSVVTGFATQTAPPAYDALLICYVGYGKVVSIVSYVNDDSFSNAMTDFVKSISLVKPQVAAQVTTTTPGVAIAGSAEIGGMWRSACDDKTDITSITNAAGTGFSYLSTTTGLLRTRHVLFLDDGTVANFPGINGFMDYQKQRHNDPNYWGTWTYQNGSGTVKLDGLSGVDAFTIKNNVMIYSGCQFIKLPWVEDLKLNGTYTWEADPARYKANGMNAEPILKFSADGRFSDVGAIYYLNHIEHSFNSDYSDNKYGDGRYEVKRHTLSLYFDDGRVYHYTYLNFDGNKPDPAQLSIGMKFMTKK